MSEERAILLVEDDVKDQELALRALRKNMIRSSVVVLRDGRDALDYLLAHGSYAGRDPQPLPDLILLDLKLPRKVGS